MSAPCLAGGTSARKTRTELHPGQVLASWIEPPIDAHEFNQTAPAPDAPTLPNYAPGHDHDVPCVLPVVMQSRRGGMGPRRGDFRAKCHGGAPGQQGASRLLQAPRTCAHDCGQQASAFVPTVPSLGRPAPTSDGDRFTLSNQSLTFLFRVAPTVPTVLDVTPGGSAVARRRRSALAKHWRGWMASRLAHASMAGARCVLSYPAPVGGGANLCAA